MTINYKVSLIFLLILQLCVLQSCSLLRMTLDEEFNKVSDTLSLTLKKNQLTLKALINDKETSLLFDTGSQTPLLFNDSILDEKKPEKISKFGIFNNLGNKLDFYRTPLKFEIDLLKSSNTVFVVIPKFYALNKCSNIKFSGIYYGRYFDDKILNINFEQEKLFVLDSFVNTTYTEIESKFFGFTQLQIKLNINGISEWFHFDTGNILYPITLNKKSELLKDMDYNYKVESSRLSLVKKYNITYFYEDVKIHLGNENINSYITFNDGTKNYKYNNVGIQFIKNYNWIIDYKNKKVYYKSYKNPESNFIKISKDQLNKVTVEEGKLIIIQILNQTEKPNYKLGDEIISVNETSITSKNICSYLKLLNDSDWNTLSIETKS